MRTCSAGRESDDQLAGLERDVELGTMPEAVEQTQSAWGSLSFRYRAALDGHGRSWSSVLQTMRTGQAIRAASSGQPWRRAWASSGSSAPQAA
jgi:hypothetical protein